MSTMSDLSNYAERGLLCTKLCMCIAQFQDPYSHLTMLTQSNCHHTNHLLFTSCTCGSMFNWLLSWSAHDIWDCPMVQWPPRENFRYAARGFVISTKCVNALKELLQCHENTDINA